MMLMYDEKLKIAYDKSNEVVSLLSYDEKSMISTQAIIDVVEKHYCPEVIIKSASFAKIGISEGYGAMMSTVLDEGGNNPPVPHSKQNRGVFCIISFSHHIH